MTKISRRVALLGLAVLAAIALYAAVGAGAAGSFAAHAGRPSYDAGSLELSGHGAYTTARRHSELRVTVCLQKRLGGRAFSVRCATGAAAGKRVSAGVGVPGCVQGTWHTTATGEAQNGRGEWVHQASATSPPFHC
ncbi:MAG TPA: hypothetical protein VGI17_08570 [Solirubrobacterales bacterium]